MPEEITQKDLLDAVGTLISYARSMNAGNTRFAFNDSSGRPIAGVFVATQPEVAAALVDAAEAVDERVEVEEAEDLRVFVFEETEWVVARSLEEARGLYTEGCEPDSRQHAAEPTEVPWDAMERATLVDNEPADAWGAGVLSVESTVLASYYARRAAGHVPPMMVRTAIDS